MERNNTIGYDAIRCNAMYECKTRQGKARHAMQYNAMQDKTRQDNAMQKLMLHGLIFNDHF